MSWKPMLRRHDAIVLRRAGAPVDAGVHLAGVTLSDLVAVFVAEPLDRLEDGYNILEISARLRVNGINRPKHLSGEQDVVYPHPFDQQLHGLSVINGHIPVHSAGGLFKRLMALPYMHAPMPVPLVRDSPAAVRN